MTATTYRIESIKDLLAVPIERREACVREILYLLALTELAGVQDVIKGGLIWTDDGDKSASIHDTTGKPFLTLQVTE